MVDHALGRGVPTTALHPAVKCVSCGICEDVDFVTSDPQPGSLGSAVTLLAVRVSTRGSWL